VSATNPSSSTVEVKTKIPTTSKDMKYVTVVKKTNGKVSSSSSSSSASDSDSDSSSSSGVKTKKTVVIRPSVVPTSIPTSSLKSAKQLTSTGLTKTDDPVKKKSVVPVPVVKNSEPSVIVKAGTKRKIQEVDSSSSSSDSDSDSSVQQPVTKKSKVSETASKSVVKVAAATKETSAPISASPKKLLTDSVVKAVPKKVASGTKPTVESKTKIPTTSKDVKPVTVAKKTNGKVSSSSSSSGSDSDSDSDSSSSSDSESSPLPTKTNMTVKGKPTIPVSAASKTATQRKVQEDESSGNSSDSDSDSSDSSDSSDDSSDDEDRAALLQKKEDARKLKAIEAAKAAEEWIQVISL